MGSGEPGRNRPQTRVDRFLSSPQSESMRRPLGEMIEEYSRHTGHADLIREAVDGRVGEDPPGRPYPGGAAPGVSDAAAA